VSAPPPAASRRVAAGHAALAALLGAGAGLVVRAWDLTRPSLDALAGAGILPLLDGIAVLPAVLAARVVRKPGAVLIAVIAAQVVRYAPGDAVTLAGAVLQGAIAAALAEIWLLARGRDRGRLTLAVAGAAAAAGSVPAAGLLGPVTVTAGLWAPLLASGMVGGAAVGWAVAATAAAAARAWARRQPGPDTP